MGQLTESSTTESEVGETINNLEVPGEGAVCHLIRALPLPPLLLL